MNEELGLIRGLDNPLEEKTVEEVDYSVGEITGALFDTNIIGHKWLWNNGVKWNYEEQDYNEEEATNVLNEFGIATEDRIDLIDKSRSIEELRDRAKYKQEVQESTQIVESLGGTGLALSLGVSLLDIPSWALGAGLGKAAALGSTAMKFGRTGQTLAQGAAGAGTALGSVYTLETLNDNDLSLQQTAVTAGLGFAIGYGSARLQTTDINANINAAKTAFNMNVNKPIMSFLRSDADMLKFSDNLAEREAGLKATPSMEKVGLQNIDTVADMDASYNSFTHKHMNQMDDYIKEFESTNNKKFDEQDQTNINYIGHNIDAKYKQVKDAEYIRLEEQYKPEIDSELEQTIKQVEDSYIANMTPEAKNKISKVEKELDEILKQKETELKNKSRDFASKENKKIYKEIEKIKRKRKSQYSKVEAELKAENRKRILESEKAIKASGKLIAEEKKIRDRWKSILDNLKPIKGKRRANGVAVAEKKAKADMRAEISAMKENVLKKKRKELEASYQQDLKKRFAEINKVDEIRYNSLKNRYGIKPNNISEDFTKIKDKITKQYQKKIDTLKQGTIKGKSYKNDINKAKKEVKDKWNKKIRDESRVNSKPKLDEFINSVDPKYRKAIDIMSSHYRGYGDELNTHNVNGIEVDSSFYWSRNYDVNKIANDTDGAIDAFERAIRANFDEIDSELSEKIREQATKIVDNISASKTLFESLDADRSFISKELAGENRKIGKLKGRKLRINARELTSFMSNDVMSNMKDYGHKVSGKLKLKRAYGIDDNYKFRQYVNDKGFTSEGIKRFKNVIEQTEGVRSVDPKGNTMGARLVRSFNSINFINLGGFFGVNTLSDLAGIVNDYGFTRTAKYLTKDVVDTLKGEGKTGLKVARYLGYSNEGMLGDRAGMWNSSDYGQNRFSKTEIVLQKGSNLMSKLSGMNMVVDSMDRVASMSSLDYILTANRGTKFVNNMNRLGLSVEDIDSLRVSNFTTMDNVGITDVDFTKLPKDLEAKLERALSRAVRDTVIKANELDTPDFLVEIFGSKQIAKVLFQFMRFPVIAYNKLYNKMIHNFDVVDATLATATAAMVLSMTTQLKDIGKEEKRFDLDTEEGQINTAKYVIDRMPHLAPIGLIQSHIDVLGRLAAKYNDEDYTSYDKPISHLGVAPSRIAEIIRSSGNMLSGDFSYKDANTAKTLLGTNLLWLQPFNNMANDLLRDELE